MHSLEPGICLSTSLAFQRKYLSQSDNRQNTMDFLRRAGEGDSNQVFHGCLGGNGGPHPCKPGYQGNGPVTSEDSETLRTTKFPALTED